MEIVRYDTEYDPGLSNAISETVLFIDNPDGTTQIVCDMPGFEKPIIARRTVFSEPGLVQPKESKDEILALFDVKNENAILNISYGDKVDENGEPLIKRVILSTQNPLFAQVDIPNRMTIYRLRRTTSPDSPEQ